MHKIGSMQRSCRLGEHIQADKVQERCLDTNFRHNTMHGRSQSHQMTCKLNYWLDLKPESKFTWGCIARKYAIISFLGISSHFISRVATGLRHDQFISDKG